MPGFKNTKKADFEFGDNAGDQFHKFMSSPAVQERLKHTPPDKLEEEIGKIIAEYNASLQNSDEEESRDFPISIEELEAAYEIMKHNVPQKKKESLLKPLKRNLPFLDRLCKNSTAANAVSDIIAAVATVYLSDTNILGYDKLHQEICTDANSFVSAYRKDKPKFYNMTAYCVEPNLILFLADSVAKLNLPTNEFKLTLSTLIAWGLVIQTIRFAENHDRYMESNDA